MIDLNLKTHQGLILKEWLSRLGTLRESVLNNINIEDDDIGHYIDESIKLTESQIDSIYSIYGRSLKVAEWNLHQRIKSKELKLTNVSFMAYKVKKKV